MYNLFSIAEIFFCASPKKVFFRVFTQSIICSESMKILILIIYILLASFSGVAKNTCVLFFERPEHPFFEPMQNIFANQQKVDFIPLAQPLDFLKCVEAGAQEILIVAHAFEVKLDDRSFSKLGFFIPLERERSENLKSQTIQNLQQSLQEIRRTEICRRPMNGKGPYRCTQRQAIRRALRIVDNTKEGDQMYQLLFGYEKGLFLNRPFELALKWMRSNKGLLKKIRWMSCDPNKVISSYPALKDLVEEFQIEMDVAPRNWFLSQFSEVDVTSFDEDWIKQSLRHSVRELQ